MTIVTFVCALADRFVDFDDKAKVEIEQTAREARVKLENAKESGNKIVSYLNNPYFKLFLMIVFPLAVVFMKNKINQSNNLNDE